MSNQPKITYRSDTTASSYQMMQRNSAFVIQVLNLDSEVIFESPEYRYVMPWRNTIYLFFDVVNVHINTNKWSQHAYHEMVARHV
jgi:hypothetical protein